MNKNDPPSPSKRWHSSCTLQIVASVSKPWLQPEVIGNKRSTDGLVMARLNNEDHYLGPAINAVMRSLERMMAGIAPTDIPVCIIRDNGTDKQAVAAKIHRLSRQIDEPFIHVSCAVLTLSGLNRWLCGDGAPGGRLAITGTLFLDEISEMEATCQSRLLLAVSAGNSFDASGPCLEELAVAGLVPMWTDSDSDRHGNNARSTGRGK